MTDLAEPRDPWAGVTGGDDGCRALAALVPDMLCICREGRIVAINPAGLTLLGGVAPADLLGLPFASFIHPDYAPLAEMGLAVLADEPEGVPLLLVARDGTPREVHLRARRLSGSDSNADAGLLLHGRDVTERRHAVEGLLGSEQRFRSLVDHSLALICVVRDGRVAFMNGEGRRLLAAPDAQVMVGRPLVSLLHRDYAGLLEVGLSALASEPDMLPMRMVALDGRVLDVEARVVPFRAERAETFMFEARDISERKRVALALREREQRLQGVLDTVSEAIVTTDGTGRIRSFNPAACDMFGYAAAEVIGRNVTILMRPEFATYHDSYYERGSCSITPRVLGLARDLDAIRKDGTTFPIEISVSRVRLADGLVVTGIIRDITERRRREEAERRYKEDLETKVRERTWEVRRLGRQTELILNSAGDGIVGLDADGRVTFANPVAERLLRAERDSLRGRALAEVFRADERRAPPDGLRRLVAGQGARAHGETVLLTLDGQTFPAEFAAAPITDAGDRLGVVVVFRDISARKEAEEHLRLAYTVFATASEGIVVCDAGHGISMINPAFTEIMGYAEDAVLGQPVASVLFDSPRRFAAMTEALAKPGGEWTGEFWHQRDDGTELALRVAASAVGETSETAHQIALVISDITQRKRDEERIHYQAKHDALTGLGNRALFLEVLTAEVDRAVRDGHPLALMFIDLDGFKAVNDTLGHEAGDQLLRGAAQRISRAARDADTVARLGGDEFTVILPQVPNRETAAGIAARILEVVSAPFSLNHRMARVSGSIGVALVPEDGTDAETILRHADAAMYHAKAMGKANVQFYRPDLESRPNLEPATADAE
ncbi:sensor domain-containing protein [Rhodospira trueperi]|uniref:PAS domain S-box-containing protein/diguanylate cyclase (GGDEF) domain-containing protein n=1 Tax=Rhodospira trueperi TaxID=69960 RepID=A0A1G7FE29_9PROT|nr:PAS domain S-box protein [Rhodospira trueperi]SDE74146.1 PAS domain S-box-containing protein/diguanylate cyclase (GGDEF) domain-containing protein [Rhodospira trueperi]